MIRFACAVHQVTLSISTGATGAEHRAVQLVRGRSGGCLLVRALPVATLHAYVRGDHPSPIAQRADGGFAREELQLAEEGTL